MHLLARFQVSSLVLAAHPTYASKIFHPNCTIPLKSVNLVTSSTIRGTFDILWSCLFTLLICTWTIQHLNVPAQRLKKSKTSWQGLKDLFYGKGGKTLWEALSWTLNRPWRKLKWMVITLMVPELLVGLEFQNLILACRYCKEIKTCAAEDQVEWSLTHTFLANMGGFVLKVTSAPETEGSSPGEQLWYLTASDLYQCRRTGIISKLPNITIEEIEDKSQGDFFIKGTAIIQVLWLLIQCIVRTIRDLPISQLEIMVLAFCACSFTTYLLSWMKPQNVMVPIYVPGNQTFISELRIPKRRRWLEWTWKLELKDAKYPLPNDHEFMTNFDFIERYSGYTLIDDGFLVAGMMFGALHCFAWNYQFPHPSERLLWRLSALFTTVSLPMMYLFGAILHRDYPHQTKPVRNYFLRILIMVLKCAYPLGRLFLVVESFRTLFFLPPKSFISTWPGEIVHIA